MSIFFEFVRTSLLRSKKLYFLSRISKNVSFLLFLLKKTCKKKVDFLTLLEFYFACLKSILYYREYQKMFFSSFVCSIKTYKRMVEFLSKPWTNIDFFDFARDSLFKSKRILYFPKYQKIFLYDFFAKKNI